jgi:hypothetical protein
MPCAAPAMPSFGSASYLVQRRDSLMTRRSLSACLGAAALVGSLGMPAGAKPPDLPMNETITVAPKEAPVPEHTMRGWLLPSKPEQESEPTDPIIEILILHRSATQMPAHPLLKEVLVAPPAEEVVRIWRAGCTCLYELKNGQCVRGVHPAFLDWVAEEQSPPVESIYEALPASVPTPTLYELHPTARRTLVGSMLLGINPALALLPTEQALDAPHDHPRRVAGDDIFVDMPKHVHVECYSNFGVTKFEEVDWFKWLTTLWAARNSAPAPEQNEGYVYVASLETAEDSPAGEPLPMPQEDAVTDGISCPYLRQQRMDRHACQLTDPQIGRDVLENLERLQQADDLMKLAEKLIRDGCIIEAIECCALACDLCPGSPCADRAGDMMLDLYLRLSELATATEETAEEQGIEKKLTRSISVNFTNVPLRQVIDDLRANLGINIYVDEPALAEKGINIDQLITVKLEDIAFKSALNLIVHYAGLRYIVKEEVVQITTEEHAHGKLMQRVYAVADLLEHEDLPKNSGIRACEGKSGEKRLIEVITNTVSPRSWSANGGIGTIDYFPPTKALVVNQTAEVQEQISDLLAALHRLYDQEEEQKEETLPEKKADGSATEPGVEQQVDGLMKACRLLMNEGLHERAAELARQAYALDPERVLADPLIYKMHLLADTPAKQPFGSSRPAGASEEGEEPATCPYCPGSGKPIQGILPQKNKSKSGPTTLLVPPLPPVDYEVVPALDRELTKSAKTAPPSGAEEASASEAPSSLSDLIERIMGDTGPERGQLGVGVNADGCLQVSGEWSCGGHVYHLRYNRGCLAIWKTPDAAKGKP